MPEPISIAVGICYMGYATLASYSRHGNAVSSEALFAVKSVSELVESAQRSMVLFGDKTELLSQLTSINSETNEPDWLEQGNQPVSKSVLEIVSQFIRVLPDNVLRPEIAPDPNGTLLLEWISTRTNRLSVSVNENGLLSYAWMDGTQRGYAISQFDGNSVPERLIREIQNVKNLGVSTIRFV